MEAFERLELFETVCEHLELIVTSSDRLDSVRAIRGQLGPFWTVLDCLEFGTA